MKGSLIGVVFAPNGGELRSLSNEPKPMVNVMGKPLLIHVADNLRSIGALRVIAAVEDNVNVEGVELSRLSNDYWGTLKLIIKETPRGSTVVFSSTEYYVPREAYEALLNTHLSMGYDATMLVTAVEDTSSGVVVHVNSEGRVTGLSRGMGPGYLFLNLMVIERNVFEDYGELNWGSIKAGVHLWNGWFTRVNSPWSLLDLTRNLLSGLRESTISTKARISPKASIEGLVVIDDDAVLDHNCTLRGPVYVGKGAYVGTGALLRNHTSIEEGAVIGANAEVTESLVGPRATVGRGSFIGASLIGPRAVVEPGVVTLTTTVDRKIGAVIGGGARVGANSVIKPGSVVKPSELINPLTYYG
ncbi:NDP-sugar synthase [Caldivirga maquilingensis]|uniref:NDP-sugar synthase n=1 Tax=Caldivirga maquilingensis TaxID=76887 RepID=UPI00068F96E9|nr:NDP-sugar synthase [Caldivirga maquilingensis]